MHTSKIVRSEALWLVSGAILLTLLFYYRAVALPLYMDDNFYMWDAERKTIPELFYTATVLPYYRPLSLLGWKLALIVTPTIAPLMHVLNVLLHAANGWLCALLVRRIAPHRPLAMWLAMVIYILFPFSYQAVAWASSGVHLMVAFGALIATLFVDHWWESRRWSHLMLVWAGVLFATFSHENGVITSLILAGWIIIGKLNLSLPEIARERNRLILLLVSTGAINLIFLIIWFSIPKEAVGVQIRFDDIPVNVLYFGQGLTYPIAQFGGALTAAGLSNQTAAVLLVLGGLGLLGALLMLTKNKQGWLGIWWYMVAVMPAVLLLSWSLYVSHGPRLMLTPSIGAAVAWAIGIDALWVRLTPIRRLIPVTLIALLVVGGGWFVQTRMALHTTLASLYQAVNETAMRDGSSVFFNLPAWIAPRYQVYALGDEGITYMPEYTPLSELVWSNTGIRPEVTAVVREDIAVIPPDLWAGYVEGDAQGQSDIEIVAEAQYASVALLMGDRWLWESLEVMPDQAFDNAANFINGTRLIPSAALDRDTNYVRVELIWELTRQSSATVFVHLVCNDSLLTQSDGAPLRGIFPFDAWSLLQARREVRWLARPAAVDTDCLMINVGLYDPSTNQRVLLETGTDSVTVPISD